MTSYRHLAEAERRSIEQALRQGKSLKAAARELGRSPSTISREIQRNITVRQAGGFNRSFNPCARKKDCRHSRLCPDKPCTKKFCRDCGLCHAVCPDFQRQSCPRLSRPPYTCTGCASRRSCTMEKFDYDAKAAHKTAQKVQSEARSGFLLDETERRRLDALISPLIKQGQSIYHICQTHRDEIMLDPKTVYRYVNAGLLEARRMDLPRAVRLRPRRKKRPLKVERSCFTGRTYPDFLAFMEESPELPAVEMDTVEGRKGGKVLLTLHFRASAVTLAFIRPANTAASVKEIMDRLYRGLGRQLFCRLLPIILTDRGSEFSNPSALELDPDGEPRTRIFYCDPQASFQKGSLENAHHLFRRVLPKGTSLDFLSPELCSRLNDHVNSYARKKLNGKSPYETFSFLHGEEALQRLGCTIIPADQIHLLPDLLN